MGIEAELSGESIEYTLIVPTPASYEIHQNRVLCSLVLTNNCLRVPLTPNFRESVSPSSGTRIATSRTLF